MRYRLSFLLLVSLGLSRGADAQIKIYVSADMEGVTGAVTDEQLGPDGFEYQRFRSFMTQEVLAAIRGARAAGATQILVSDSHGNGQNLLIDELPEDVQVVRSWPRPLGMMEGIDESFHAVLFIGYHSSTSNPDGVRAHTFSSATLTDVRLDGRSVAEADFNAAIAGHFGVPVVMISGDDAIVAEAKAKIGDLEGAVVKWARSFHSARTLTPQAGYKVIEAAAKRGVERRSEIPPLRSAGPVALEVSFKHYRQTELLAYLPMVQRIDSHSIRFEARDILEASRFMQFVNGYQPGLSP
ncbi:MAG TPA: M55 family metallopeptidase [Vicinamibacteria bacterium]|nr:M55 family metallopeptidase [Vicinamibacteria bacterium]